MKINMKLNLLSGAALCLVGGVMACADTAIAQETGDIVVTATRREQALQEVPLAVSSLSADALTAKNITSLSDVTAGAIPGLQVSQFAGTPSILGFAIRGHGNSDPGQGSVENPVALYVDGVFLGRAQGTGLELLEPERIEVLRGPQGQLFGRNAEAGAIQYVTKKPSGKFGFDVSASAGNYDSRRYKGRIDLPEFAGVSLQLSAISSEHGPYTVNPNKGTYVNQADYGDVPDAHGVRLAARWAPTESFTADYTYDNSRSKDSQPALTYVVVDSGRPAIAAVPPSTEYPESLSGPLFNEYFITTAEGHALTLGWSVSDAITLKSITAYRETSRHGSSTLSDALAAGASAGGFFYPNAREDVDAKQTSQEFQLLGSWDRFDVTAGAIYFHEKVDDNRSSFMSGPGLSSAVGFSPPALSYCALFALDPCQYGETRQNVDADSYGLYAQGTYTPPILNDRLEVTAGIRYSDDSKDFARTYNLALGGPLATPQTSKFNEKRWDPAVTLKYSWTDNFNTYLRYATAYRAGGANVRSSTFGAYDSEEIETWEFGAKSRWLDKRVTLNGALYHNTIKGQQINIQEQPILNPSLTTGFNRTDDFETTGLELEFSAKLTKGLTLGVNYAHTLDSDGVTEFDNPLTPAFDLTRIYPINESKNSGSVSLDYVTQTFPLGELRLHGDYSFATAFWSTPGGILVAPLGPNYQRPTSDVSQLSARFAWAEIPLGGQARGELAFWGKNLLDNNAILYGFDGGAFGGGFANYRTVPETYGVELRVKY